MNYTQTILQLYEIQAIQFGNFTLKSGISSPIYIDLRRIISYPLLLQDISSFMMDLVKDVSFDVICGVPYTALPIATCMSIEHNIPMVMRRKEAKTYGTKKTIEGAFKQGETCLIVEDLVTSGSSVLETITPINEAGLNCKDVVVLIDRQQGGRKALLDKGYNLYSVLTITNIFETLFRHEKISMPELEKVKSFIKAHQF